MKYLFVFVVDVLRLNNWASHETYLTSIRFLLLPNTFLMTTTSMYCLFIL